MGRASDLYADGLLPRPCAGLVKAKPDLAQVEPFKTVLSGDREEIGEALDTRLLRGLRSATHTGMDVDAFAAEVENVDDATKDHRWKRLYTELMYQPMIEVLSFFRANGYRTFIVTGGGQAFVRVYSPSGLWRPPRAGDRDRAGSKIRLRQGPAGRFSPRSRSSCSTTSSRQARSIFLDIGRRPYAAFGNS